MKITTNSAVTFHYTLRDGSGDQIESSFDKAPMAYLHGAGNIIPGLERALAGKAAGDKFQVTLEPKDAYGERQDSRVRRVAAKYFANPKMLKPGQLAVLQTQEGPAQVTVLKVGRFNVDVDTNHPLAGETLTFDVEITDVREATEEELEHGHIHGPGGVAH